MTKCRAYTYQTTPASPLFPLLEALRRAGTTDSDLDTGYHQIDYYRPGETGRVEGAGDCFIDDREVLRHATDNWRRFRPQIQKWRKKPLPWDRDLEAFQGKPPAEIEKRREFVAQQKAAILCIKRDLAQKGLKEGTDEYRLTFAEALFWWYEFPRKEYWKTVPADERAEMLKKFARIDELGLVRLKAYLVESGGAGHFPVIERPAEVPSPELSFQYSGSVSSAAFDLYYTFDTAGLKPSFVEVTDIPTDSFTCGIPISSRLAVGIHLSHGELRTFDIDLDNPRARGVHYPLELRQALAIHLASEKTAGIFVFGDRSDSGFSEHISADGFLPLNEAFTSWISALIKREEEGLTVDSAAVLRAQSQIVAANESRIHPLFLIYMHYLVVAKVLVDNPSPARARAEIEKLSARLFSHPALRGSRYIDNFHFFTTMSQDAYRGTKKIVDDGRRVLATDPACFMAHMVLATEGARGNPHMSDDEIEGHFRDAAAQIPPGHKVVSSLYLKWGEYEMRKKRYDSASEKFLVSFNTEGGDNDDRAKSAFYLAMQDARNGDFEKAAEWLKHFSKLSFEDISKSPTGTTAQRWLDWITKQRSAYPLTPEMIADGRIPTAYAILYLNISKAFMKDRKLAKAAEAAKLAVGILPSGAALSPRLQLHEVLIQAGDSRRADRVWREITKTVGIH